MAEIEQEREALGAGWRTKRAREAKAPLAVLERCYSELTAVDVRRGKATDDRDAPRIFNAIAQAEDLDGKPDMQHPALLRVSAVLSGTLAEVLSEALFRYFSAKF